MEKEESQSLEKVTSAREFIGQTVDVVMDRTLGTKHPKHGFIYEANYGFIPGTLSPDGEELDAYVLGINDPIKEFRGKCVAFIHRTNDDDDKLIIIPEDMSDISDDEIRQQTHFQEKFFESIIVRK